MGFIFGMQQAGIHAAVSICGCSLLPLVYASSSPYPRPPPHPLIHTWKKIRNSVSLTKT